MSSTIYWKLGLLELYFEGTWFESHRRRWEKNSPLKYLFLCLFEVLRVPLSTPENISQVNQPLTLPLSKKRGESSQETSTSTSISSIKKKICGNSKRASPRVGFEPMPR